MTFAPKPPPARSAPRGRAFFVSLRAVSPRTVPPNVAPSRRVSPRPAPHRPSLRPRPQTLQRPRPHFRLLAVQRFGHRPPPKAKPYLCIVKTKPPSPPSSHLVNPLHRYVPHRPRRPHRLLSHHRRHPPPRSPPHPPPPHPPRPAAHPLPRTAQLIRSRAAHQPPIASAFPPSPEKHTPRRAPFAPHLGIAPPEKPDSSPCESGFLRTAACEFPTLQCRRSRFRLLPVQRFGHRPPLTANPYLCRVKTKPSTAPHPPYRYVFPPPKPHRPVPRSVRPPVLLRPPRPVRLHRRRPLSPPSQARVELEQLQHQRPASPQLAQRLQHAAGRPIPPLGATRRQCPAICQRTHGLQYTAGRPIPPLGAARRQRTASRQRPATPQRAERLQHAAGRPLHLANAAQLPPPPLPRAVRSHAHSPLPRQHHQRPHRQLQRPHRRHLRPHLPLIPPLALVSTLRPFPLPLRSTRNLSGRSREEIPPLPRRKRASPFGKRAPSHRPPPPSFGQHRLPIGKRPRARNAPPCSPSPSASSRALRPPRTRFRPTPIGCGAVFRVKITDLTPSPPDFQHKSLTLAHHSPSFQLPPA